MVVPGNVRFWLKADIPACVDLCPLLRVKQTFNCRYRQLVPRSVELVEEWRGRAGRNLGIVISRVERMLGRISPDEGRATVQWLDNLEAAQATAIMRALLA
jgi:hypothetical protein